MSTRPVEIVQKHRCSARPVEGTFCTPWGDGAVTILKGALVGVQLPPVRGGALEADWEAAGDEDSQALEHWTGELEAYFLGERLSWCLEDVDLEIMGLTAFGTRTVEALMTVPAGTTVSYGELAALAGFPRAARAVGTVMSSNRIPIVVPCHRVIRSDGSMGRYGDDSSWKARLLEHERSSLERGDG